MMMPDDDHDHHNDDNEDDNDDVDNDDPDVNIMPAFNNHCQKIFFFDQSPNLKNTECHEIISLCTMQQRKFIFIETKTS